MKTQHQAGANFLRKWQGQAPAGRSSGDLAEQKGQAKEAVIRRSQRVYDPSQKMIVRKWSF